MHFPAVSFFLAAFSAVLGGAPTDWPEFRGPTGQGHAPEGVRLPTRWSETEHIVWRTPIPGKGWSTPVVGGGLVWMTTASPDGRSLRAAAVDAKTGATLRDVEVFAPTKPCPINPKNSYASPSPVLDEGRLFVHFGTMGTAALDARTGEILWRNTELQLDHKEGPGSSPVSWGRLLIVNCDGMDVQYVAALDKESGAVVWRTDRPGEIHENPDFRKAYSTPLAIDTGRRVELISPGAQQVLAYDPTTGEALWRVRYNGFSNVPRPLYGKGLVYVCTGYMKPQLWAIRPGGDGDATDSHVVWKFDRQVPANPSPIFVDDAVYMTSNNGILTCLDAETGQARWTERLGGAFSSSPIYGDGKLYFSSEEGVTTVVRPGPSFEKLAENLLDGTIMASPVASGDSIYLRTDRALYRISEADVVEVR